MMALDLGFLNVGTRGKKGSAAPSGGSLDLGFLNGKTSKRTKGKQLDPKLADALRLAEGHNDQIQSSDAPDSAKKHSKSILERVGSNPIVKALGVLDLGRSAVVSGLHEGLDAVGANDGKSGASWHDFVEQTKQHQGFGQILEENGVHNKWARTIGGFIGDVALDPLTYVAPEHLLEGGNKTVAKKLLERGASEETVARALQKGASALSKDELEILGAKGGIHLNVPGTGRVGRALHLADEQKQIQLFAREGAVGKAGNLVARSAQGTLGALRNSAKWTRIAEALGGANPGLKAALRSKDPHEVVTALHSLDADARRVLGVQVAAQDFGEAYKKARAAVGSDDPIAIAHALQGRASTIDVSSLRELLDTSDSRARELVAKATGQKVEDVEQIIRHVDDYFPRQLTEEARAKLGASPVPIRGGSTHTVQSFEFSRSLKPGEEFLGEKIVRPGEALKDGSKAGAIEQQVEDIGKAALGDNWIKLFNENADQVLPLYFDSVARKVGERIRDYHLQDKGVFQPIDVVETAGSVRKGKRLAKLAEREKTARLKGARATEDLNALKDSVQSQPVGGSAAADLRGAAAEKGAAADDAKLQFAEHVTDRIKNNSKLAELSAADDESVANAAQAWSRKPELEAHVADLQSRLDVADQVGADLGQRATIKAEMDKTGAELSELHALVDEMGGPAMLGARTVAQIEQDGPGIATELNEVKRLLRDAKDADIAETMGGGAGYARAEELRTRVVDAMHTIGIPPSSDTEITAVLQGKLDGLVEHAKGLRAEHAAALDTIAQLSPEESTRLGQMGRTVEAQEQTLNEVKARLEAAGGDVAPIEEQLAHLEMLKSMVQTDGPFKTPTGGDTWMHATDRIDLANVDFQGTINDADEAIGVQFTDEPAVANFFSGNDEDHIAHAELHMKNPKVYEHVGSDPFPAPQELEFAQHANGDPSDVLSQSNVDMMSDVFSALAGDPRGREALAAFVRNPPTWSNEFDVDYLREALQTIDESIAVGDDIKDAVFHVMHNQEYEPGVQGLDQMFMRDVVGHVGSQDNRMVRELFDAHLRDDGHDGAVFWNQHTENRDVAEGGSWTPVVTNPAVVNFTNSQGAFQDIFKARDELLQEATGIPVPKLRREIGVQAAVAAAFDPESVIAGEKVNQSRIAQLVAELKKASTESRSATFQLRQEEFQLRQESAALVHQADEAAQRFEDHGIAEATRLYAVAKRSEADVLKIADNKLVKEWGNSSAEWASAHYRPHFQQVMADGMKRVNDNLQADAWLVDVMSDVAKGNTDGKWSGFFRHYDQALGVWKGYAILSPGFHFRNFMGGMFNNYLAGMEAGGYSRYLKAVARGDDEIALQIANAGIISGGGQTGAEIARGGSKLNPLSQGFAPIAGSRAIGSKVENTLRGALAYDVIAKGGSLDDAIDAVFKYHFNYEDLSHFEKTTARRVIPFYTWTRKNMPLQVEQIVRQPGKYTRYLAVKRNVEANSQAESIVPSYFGEQLGIRLPFKTGGSQDYILPDLPFKDLGKATDPGQLLGQASPAVKLPLELFAGKRVFNDIPLRDNKTAAPKIWTQIPGFMSALKVLGVASKDRNGGWLMSDRDAYKVESILPPLARARRLHPSEPRYQQRLMTTALSFAFGIGLNSNTPDAQRSEVMRRNDEISKLLASLKQRGYAGGVAS